MSNITPGHVRAYQIVRSQLFDNVTLSSCTVNDEPGVAIVMMEMVSEDKIAVGPLFVGITSGMKLDLPGETAWQEGEEGGGPRNEEQTHDDAAPAPPRPAATPFKRAAQEATSG